MIVEGQLIGGVVQGIGGTLLQELAYDSDGQLQTGSFMDYLLPSVHNMPDIKLIVLEEVPSPGNPLGVRGVGEVGISGVAAAVGNGISAALGISHGIVEVPITPERVLAAIAEAAP